jgi:hypothetical protein
MTYSKGWNAQKNYGNVQKLNAENLAAQIG